MVSRLSIVVRQSVHSRRSSETMTASTSSSISAMPVKCAPSCDRLAGSRPRSNSVPKMDGSTALQSKSAAAPTRLISSAVMSRADLSSNRLPLKWRIVSSPKSPPVAMVQPGRRNVWRRLGLPPCSCARAAGPQDCGRRRGGSFFQVYLPPLGYEFRYGHSGTEHSMVNGVGTTFI